jgi:hypothetical protein
MDLRNPMLPTAENGGRHPLENQLLRDLCADWSDTRNPRGPPPAWPQFAVESKLCGFE